MGMKTSEAFDEWQSDHTTRKDPLRRKFNSQRPYGKRTTQMDVLSQWDNANHNPTSYKLNVMHFFLNVAKINSWDGHIFSARILWGLCSCYGGNPIILWGYGVTLFLLYWSGDEYRSMPYPMPYQICYVCVCVCVHVWTSFHILI